MSTVEIDTARHEREQTRLASEDSRMWDEQDRARAELNAGGDYDTHCDQDSVYEQITSDHAEETKRLLQRLWSSQTDFDRNSAARELQDHCSRIVDDLVVRSVEKKLGREAA